MNKLELIYLQLKDIEEDLLTLAERNILRILDKEPTK